MGWGEGTFAGKQALNYYFIIFSPLSPGTLANPCHPFHLIGRVVSTSLPISVQLLNLFSAYSPCKLLFFISHLNLMHYIFLAR